VQLRSRVLPHLPAGLLYLALTLFIVAPVLGDPARLALGHPANDVWNHVWGYGWVVDQLSHGRLPLHTTQLNWPTGGSLWFIDTFGAVLTLPVQLLAGPVAAYNASYAFNFWWCGVGAYVLALQVTGHRAGALLAGVAYMTAPHFLGQAYNGISETLAAGWLPLSVAALRAAAHDPTPRRAALAGLAMGLTVLANWYYGLFAGMVLLGLIARGLWRMRARRSAREPLLEGIRALATGSVTALALAAVPFGWFLQTMHAEDAIVTRNPDFVWATLIFHNMTDALALVHPGKFYSPDLLYVFKEHLIVVVYVGHALLWPAAIGLLATRRGRPWAWMGLAAGFTLLTLGPFLYVNGDYVQILGGWLPLPFLALFKWFPMFSRISHAYRFVVGITLALSVLLAWAVKIAEQRRVPAGALAVALGVLRVAESFWGSSARFPLPVARVEIPAVMAALDGGAVLDLPVGVPVLERSAYFAYQLAHGEPVPYGLNDPTPIPLYFNRFGQYLLELERGTVELLPPELPWLDIELGRRAFLDEGLRWIVLHTERYPATQFAKTAHFLDRVATPVYQDPMVRIYRLDP
jgi:hypothetical protein